MTWGWGVVVSGRIVFGEIRVLSGPPHARHRAAVSRLSPSSLLDEWLVLSSRPVATAPEYHCSVYISSVRPLHIGRKPSPPPLLNLLFVAARASVSPLSSSPPPLPPLSWQAPRRPAPPPSPSDSPSASAPRTAVRAREGGLSLCNTKCRTYVLVDCPCQRSFLSFLARPPDRLALKSA